MSAQQAFNFDPSPVPVASASSGFWQTVPMPPQQRAEAVRAAASQDAAVIAIFRANPGKALSPSRVFAIGQADGRRWLLTSVRRSITNLATANVLAKTSVIREGLYSRPEHCWVLVQRGSA